MLRYITYFVIFCITFFVGYSMTNVRDLQSFVGLVGLLTIAVYLIWMQDYQ